MIAVNQEKINKEYIDEWYANWEILSSKLYIAHSERLKSEAFKLMEVGIAAYEALLLQSAMDNATVEDDFELYPINGRERLTFIKARPAQFASYRQLDELYKETKKRAARLRLKK